MKKLYVILSAGVIVSFITGSIIVLRRDGGETNLTSTEVSDVLAVSVYKDDTYGLSMEYPTDSEVIKLSEQDKRDKFIFKFQQSKSPEYLFNVRAETGLRLPSQLAKLDVIDLVVDGALKSLPERYPEYKLLSQNEIVVAGKSAASIEFNYVGPAKELVRQKVILVAKDSDTALYITMQSRDTDYETLKKQVFEQVVASLRLNY